MDITHFVFAFYVFLLVCVTIWFYARVTRSKKKDGGAQEKEQHLFKLYQNVEDMLSGFEEYAEEAKVAIDERLKQAEALIADARVAVEGKFVSAAAKRQPVAESGVEPEAAGIKPDPESKPMPKIPVRKEDKPKPEAVVKKAANKRAAEPEESKPMQEGKMETVQPQSKGKAAEGKSRQNVDELIPQYIAQGMSKEEVARALGISTREVSLILEVKKISIPDRQN